MELKNFTPYFLIFLYVAFCIIVFIITWKTFDWFSWNKRENYRSSSWVHFKKKFAASIINTIIFPLIIVMIISSFVENKNSSSLNSNIPTNDSSKKTGSSVLIKSEKDTSKITSDNEVKSNPYYFHCEMAKEDADITVCKNKSLLDIEHNLDDVYMKLVAKSVDDTSIIRMNYYNEKIACNNDVICITKVIKKYTDQFNKLLANIK